MKGGFKLGIGNLPDILTITELSEFLKVHHTTIRRAINSGELKALKVSKSWRIERNAVIEWLKEKE